MSKKRILFRVDGYQKIGLGHLVRCDAIAKNILKRNKNTKIFFLSILDDYSNQILRNDNFIIINFDKIESEEDNIIKCVDQIKADVLFVDNIYDYEPDFLIELRKQTQVILFHYYRLACFYTDKYILPSAHTSDAILNNKLWDKADVNFFYGPEYIIINQEIQGIKRRREKNRKDKSRLKLVVTTGGSDPKGVLIKITEWLANSNIENVDICILKGQMFMHDKALKQRIDKLPSHIRIVEYDKNELVNADVAICTFGVSTYELMYLGIPIISIGHAIPNAQGSSLLKNRYNNLIDLGLIDKLSENSFISNLELVLNSSALRNKLSANGTKIIDGKGLDRVTDLIYS